MAALVASSGAHWMLLQSVAWVGMVTAYAQDRPLAEAVVDTFDGAHPCDLCRAVAAGRQAADGADRAPAGAPATKIAKKLTANLAAEPLRLTRAGEEERLARPAQALGWRRLEAPPVPPPRRA